MRYIGFLFLSFCLFSCQNSSTPTFEGYFPEAELCHQEEQAVLIQQINHLEQTHGLKIAISAEHNTLSCEIQHRAKEQFPMASIFKIPIAVCLMKEIDAEKYRLDDEIGLTRQDLRHHSYIRYMMRGRKGLKISIRELIKLALQESDNTASDALIRLLGGPKAITAKLKQMGYDQLHVDRYYIEMLADLYQVQLPQNEEEWSFELIDGLVRKSTGTQQRAGAANFQKDPKDNGSTAQINQLLKALTTGTLLKAESTQFLTKVLKGCKTSENRLVAGVPKSVKVAHKTGTVPGVVNDAGIIYLPNNKGEIIVTAFIKESTKPKMKRDETIIAEVMALLYEYYTETLDKPHFSYVAKARKE
ncbi:MAG: class A beta-lactamase [Saprospiraceae bacterium]|nr:class A beta-lactamase [Saprospiraceae bacterium]